METVAMNTFHSFMYFLLFWASVYAKYSNKAKYLDDPEPELSIQYPAEKDRAAWTASRPGQNNTAGLMAGRSEFHWIVFIVHEKTSVRGKYPNRAVGNLITSWHVLTTCRALVVIRFDLPSIVGQPDWMIVQHKPKDVRVLFCSAFLWEQNLLKNPDGTFVPDSSGKTSGSRRVKFVLPHKDCSHKNVAHDLGLLVLKDIISPYGLRVGNMPPLLKNIKRLDLTKMVSKRWVCYVASFGFIYANDENHVARDYKVKYRAYYTPWDRCSEKMNYICWRKYQGCNDLDFVDRDKLGIKCFSTRAKIGAVCDSDRGAPLVCNGHVVGMVVRGARFDKEAAYCNDLLPLPFIVLSMGSISNYLRDLKKSNVLPNPRDDSTRSVFSHSLLIPLIFVRAYAWLIFKAP